MASDTPRNLEEIMEDANRLFDGIDRPDDEFDDEMLALRGMDRTTAMEEEPTVSSENEENEEVDDEGESYRDTDEVWENSASPDAPWIGQEAQWRASLSAPPPPFISDEEAQPVVAASVPSERPEDTGPHELLTKDLDKEELPSIIPSKPPEKMVATYRRIRTVLAAVCAGLSVATLLLGLLLVDYMDEAAHQKAKAARLTSLLEVRESQLADLRTTNYDRIGTLKQEIQKLQGQNGAQSRLRLALLMEELGLAQNDVVLASTDSREEDAMLVSAADLSSINTPSSQETPPSNHSNAKLSETDDESDEPLSPTVDPKTENAGEETEPSLVVKKESTETDAGQTTRDMTHSISLENKAEDKLDSLLGDHNPKAPSPSVAVKTQPALNGAAIPPAQVSVSLNREQVKKAMDMVAHNVQSCARDSSGQIKILVKISGQTGRVISARAIDPEFAGTSVGHCASRAVSLAKFPKFEKDVLIVKYPFVL